VLKKYNKKISILDIGCSGGDKLLYLFNNGYLNTYGIEYAANVFKSTWKQYPHLNIRKGNAENLHMFHSNTFDLVYCCHLLEHLPHPELCVKETKRLLKKQGKLVIGIPNGYNWNDIIMRGIQKLIYGKTDHLQAFSLDKINRLLKQYDFKIEKIVSDWGSLDFLLDVRINSRLLNLPKNYMYPIISKIYWTKIHFNIVASKT